MVESNPAIFPYPATGVAVTPGAKVVGLRVHWLWAGPPPSYCTRIAAAAVPDPMPTTPMAARTPRAVFPDGKLIWSIARPRRNATNRRTHALRQRPTQE